MHLSFEGDLLYPGFFAIPAVEAITRTTHEEWFFSFCGESFLKPRHQVNYGKEGFSKLNPIRKTLVPKHNIKIIKLFSSKSFVKVVLLHVSFFNLHIYYNKNFLKNQMFLLVRHRRLELRTLKLKV